MQVANKAPDEELRLRALSELRILDTFPETAYDDITKIAAQVWWSSSRAGEPGGREPSVV